MAAPLDDLLLGEGTSLRTPQVGLAEELFSIIDANRARLRQWMPWLDRNSDPAAVRAFLEASIAGEKARTCLRRHVCVDGTLAGTMGIEQIDLANRCAHIGYWVAAEIVGKGHVGRGVSHLLDHAFDTSGLDLGIVEIRAATENTRSRAVAERLGFHFDGVLRSREWLYDHYVDHAVYSLLADEWRSKRAER